MSGSITDPAVWDPTTGQFVPASQLKTSQALSPTQMPTFDGPDVQAGGAQPYSDSLLGKFTGYLGDTYNKLAGPPTSHGQPIAPSAPPAPPPPPPAPPQRPAVSPAQGAQAASGLQGFGPEPLPVPPIPPAAPPQPQVQPAAPAEAPDADPMAGISNNSRNNPLNLRFAGQNGATNVNGFAAFQSPEDGIAAAKNQFSINAGRGIDTLRGLVSSWAPPNENDTAAYINNVAHATGLNPDQKIDLRDPSVQAKLIPAMSLMENGPVKGKTSGAPQSPQVTLASSSAPAEGPAVNPLAQQASAAPAGPMYGVGESGLMDPNTMDLSRFQSTKQDKLLAMAAGLLGAPSLGQGLGKGLSNVNALTSSDRSEGLNTYKALISARQADARMQQFAQTYGLKAQQQVNNNTKTDLAVHEQGNKDLKTDTAVNATGTRLDQGQQRIAIAGVNSDARNSGDAAANASAQKENAKDVDAIDTKGNAAIGQIRTLQNFQQAISSGASPGSDMISQYKRELATRMGVNIGDTDGSSVQLAQALGKQLQVQGVQGMRGLGLRTQNEFNTFVKQVAGLDQNPDTVKTLVQPLLDGANHDLEVYHKWHSMTPSDQLQVLRQREGVSNWRAPQDEGYGASQGVSVDQPNRPTITKTSGGWQPTTTSLPGGGQITIQRTQ